MTDAQAKPPFSRVLVVDEVPDKGLEMKVQATCDECEAVATAIGVPGVAALSGQFAIHRQHGGRIQVDGTIEATITQICVVTLEPFASDVTQEVDLTFAPAPAPASAVSVRQNERSRRAQPARQRRDPVPPVLVAADEADPPDPIVDGRIDLGSVSAEFLTLALDFYPRKPGVEFTDVATGDPDDPKPSAFAALERFKDRT